jgi:hypothetical protein
MATSLRLRILLWGDRYVNWTWKTMMRKTRVIWQREEQ